MRFCLNQIRLTNRDTNKSATKFGPVFDHVNLYGDIQIGDNINTTGSCSNLGSTYKHPQ